MTREHRSAPIRFEDDAPQACGRACGDVRCGCGSLLARVVGRAVELKCRRCKKTWTIPLDGE